MTDTSPPSARQRLIDWANDQDAWVRAIVHEILATGQELPDDAIADLYAVLLAEKQLSKEAMPAVPALTLGSGVAESRDALQVLRLGDVQNVNALAAGQAIEFNPRLTVLFGENASGKSGYVRILKKLAAVRSEEDVLPNIRAAGTAGSPNAKVKYALGAEQKEVTWNGEKGLVPFTRISVFDSRAVTLHVDDALSYIYTPRDLALFSATHQAIERTRDRLDAARRETDSGANPFLQGFARETSIYPKLSTLGPQTDLAELRTLATLTDEEVQSIETLRVSRQRPSTTSGGGTASNRSRRQGPVHLGADRCGDLARLRLARLSPAGRSRPQGSRPTRQRHATCLRRRGHPRGTL